MEAAKAALSSSAGTECWELVGDERSKLGIFVGDHKAATEALARATASGNDGCSVRKYTESNVAALRELGKMFVHMQEDVETTVSHKFKLGHLILTDTRKDSQDSVIMHCDTDHDGRVGVQFMSLGGWRELSIGMAYIDRREGRRGYRMMDGRKPTRMERVHFTHGQSHWAMSGMLAGCEDMPNPGPSGEETYVHTLVLEKIWEIIVSG